MHPATHPNEFVHPRALLFLIHTLDTALRCDDCARHVTDFLPLYAWQVCAGCGWPLVYASAHGHLAFSAEAKYSCHLCRMCYAVGCFQE